MWGKGTVSGRPRERNATGTHKVAKIFHLRLAKHALLPVNGDPIGIKEAENLSLVEEMSLRVRACNEDIIQINEGAIHFPENAIHQTLKSLSSILETERHPNKLK